MAEDEDGDDGEGQDQDEGDAQEDHKYLGKEYVNSPI